MIFSEITTKIIHYLENRYKLDRNDETTQKIIKFKPEKLQHFNVFRPYRTHNKTDSNTLKKTIISVQIDYDELKDTLHWIAITKEILVEPEVSDVYLFLFWRNSDSVTQEQCLRIEANEDFCRKYVCQPQEPLESFLERTFISETKNNVLLEIGTDPMIKILNDLNNKHDWFKEEEIEKWKSFLTSNNTDLDIKMILTENNSDSYEAS